MIRLAILREEKIPHDKRVPLTPRQCRQVAEEFPHVQIVIQSSSYRCYSDEEYRAFGFEVREEVSDCDIFLGIKEVPAAFLISGKKYIFFSHTIKKQPHNRELLKKILEKKIQLIDYECLTDKEHNRVIGFGRYAGIVGAYNGILGFGKKYDLFHLKRACESAGMQEIYEELKKVKLSNIKIIITGGGRVANGACEILGALKIRKVTAFEFLNFSFREPVYAQLHSRDYHAPRDGSAWNTDDFYKNPQNYISTFRPYTRVCDLLMHCSFWDPRGPVLFTREEMRSPDFRISVIADITCDINGSIPSTMRPSAIENPFYGYDPVTEKIEDASFSTRNITVMAVDNLPCELPRDSSEDFGKNLIERVLPSLFGEDKVGLIARGTITREGKLTQPFAYLSDYVS